MSEARVIAYCSIPKDSGTYSFYRGLRPELLDLGWDMRCVTLGRQQNRAVLPDYVDDGCVALATGTDDLKAQAIEYVGWCQENGAQIHIPMNSVPALSAVPQMPRSVRLVVRCADILDYGLRIVEANAWAAHRVVVTTPRQREELAARLRVPESTLPLIPHGIDVEAFSPGDERAVSGPLQLVFAGRLEDKQKGVFSLPDLLGVVEKAGIDWRLTIAGEGVHRGDLEKELDTRCLGERVRFVGRLGRRDLAETLGRGHVFLFPSRHEGFGFSLIEAMACGCVPVASLIRGVTDSIVEDGSTGFLRPIGDGASMGHAVVELARDRARLEEMSARARAVVVEEFSLKPFAAGYHSIFDEVAGEAVLERTVSSWEEFRICPPCAPPWHSSLPYWLKQPARRVRDRLRTLRKGR